MRRAEKRAQEDELSVAGVLVLVEQHRAIGGPFSRRHFGKLVGKLCGERHLVGEVENLGLAFRLVERIDEWEQLTPRRERAGDLLDIGMQRLGATLLFATRQPAQQAL